MNYTSQKTWYPAWLPSRLGCLRRQALFVISLLFFFYIGYFLKNKKNSKKTSSFSSYRPFHFPKIGIIFCPSPYFQFEKTYISVFNNFMRLKKKSRLYFAQSGAHLMGSWSNWNLLVLCTRFPPIFHLAPAFTPDEHGNEVESSRQPSLSLKFLWLLCIWHLLELVITSTVMLSRSYNLSLLQFH